jgi:SMC interacting uncharacterized protein involved in chromosome segregation
MLKKESDIDNASENGYSRDLRQKIMKTPGGKKDFACCFLYLKIRIQNQRENE